MKKEQADRKKKKKYRAREPTTTYKFKYKMKANSNMKISIYPRENNNKTLKKCISLLFILSLSFLIYFY